MTWYWISLNYATYGIAVDEKNIVRRAAPIAKWMLGQDFEKVTDWVSRKKGRILPLIPSELSGNHNTKKETLYG